MHDIAMAALTVFLMRFLALLAARADTSSVSDPWERGRPARTRPEAGSGRPAEGPQVFKRARCPRSQGALHRSCRLVWGDAK